ncbi:hypothetical protein DET49_10339 [Salegentibacter sp. 24]|uniref:hypothetical protein n=1 Tax=Salegentibacter sp. 24 TaxID=2183986 RepID=UPI00105C27E3|nr:hypothetical protein [Salegentibacter sp. 24]TDN94973.1 hypothetical protein DET49_10339 [Salegentibacter sp. 24]
MINLDGLEGFDNLEDLNKEIQKRVLSHNQGNLDDFDGLSPEQMFLLEQDFREGKGPLVLNQLSEKELVKFPLLVQVRFLMDQMKGGKTIRLTKTGALPPKLVKQIYELGCLKNEWIEKGISKLNKESDAEEISITRILLELSNLTKKRKGKLSLTKKGEKYAGDGNYILTEILDILLHKFNWAYFDRYESMNIGRVNPAFTLFLLRKYGDKKRTANFYSEKYFKAFPQLLEGKEYSYACYELRSFERYFKFMGFVEVEKTGILDSVKLKKTSFFDRIFSLRVE